MIFNSALTLLRNCFAEGDAGDDAALVLRRTFPDLVNMLTPMLRAQSREQIFNWITSNKILAPIALEEGFNDFVGEFIHGILHDEQPDPACALCKQKSEAKA